MKKKTLKTKLLFVLPSLAGGGAERVVLTLLAHLSRREFELSLIIFEPEYHEFDAFLPKDVGLIRLDKGRLRQALFGLYKHIRLSKPDVVFSTLDHLNLVMGLMRPFIASRTKLVLRATDLGNLKPGLFTRLLALSFAWADGIIYQSSSMKTAFEAALGKTPTKAVVINNPLNLEKISAHASLHKARQEGAALRLICAGRLTPAKGFDTLIEAVAGFQDANIELKILGDGVERLALEALRDRLGLRHQITFLGFEANPYPHLAEADGFVLSSRHEGFPNIVLEALACGTPVLATPIPGIDGLLSDIAGCHLADGFGVSHLKQGLKAFIERGLPRVDPSRLEAFDAPKIAEAYGDFLSSLIADKLPKREHL